MTLEELGLRNILHILPSGRKFRQKTINCPYFISCVRQQADTVFCLNLAEFHWPQTGFTLEAK